MSAPPLYFDHAATSLPRRRVALAALEGACELANPGRGNHRLVQDAQVVLDQARASVRALAGYGHVVFTAGATHALNQGILGLRPRPTRVLLCPLAHNAARRPALRLGVPVSLLPHDARGRIDVASAARELGPGDLLLLTHGSNVSGLVQPVGELVRLARQRGARTVVDAAQTAGVLPLDVGEPTCLAFGAHKGLASVPGAGALILADEVALEPLLHGGTGSDAVADEMPASPPERFEAGTLNLPAIAAFGAAAREPLPSASHIEYLSGALRDAVASAGATVAGANGELPVVSFTLEGWRPQEVEEVLDRAFDIIVRAGLHCAPLAHQTLASFPYGSVRASLSGSILAPDLDVLTRAIRELRRPRAS